MFIHIKMLWGLLNADSVPEPPSLRDLEEFYSHFSNEQHINKAAQTSSPAIINPPEVELLKDTRAGQIQLASRAYTWATTSSNMPRGSWLAWVSKSGAPTLRRMHQAYTIWPVELLQLRNSRSLLDARDMLTSTYSLWQ
jgi:hypothetical protein